MQSSGICDPAPPSAWRGWVSHDKLCARGALLQMCVIGCCSKALAKASWPLPKCLTCKWYHVEHARKGGGKLARFVQVRCCENKVTGGWGEKPGMHDHVRTMQGIDTEEDYPYTAEEGMCQRDKLRRHALSIDGFEDVPENSEVGACACCVNMRHFLLKAPVIVCCCLGVACFRGMVEKAMRHRRQSEFDRCHAVGCLAGCSHVGTCSLCAAQMGAPSRRC